MNKTISTTIVGVLALGVSGAVFAYDDYGAPGAAYYDYAKVEQVKPIYRLVRVDRPRRECWQENVVHREPANSSKTPIVVGGIIGGAVGHQFGKGRGRDIATVAGALLGASIGNDMRNRSYYEREWVDTQDVCREVVDYTEERQVVAYEVTYRYHGRRYVTEMDHDPGSRVRVEVDVAPVH